MKKIALIAGAFIILLGGIIEGMEVQQPLPLFFLATDNNEPISKEMSLFYKRTNPVEIGGKTVYKLHTTKEKYGRAIPITTRYGGDVYSDAQKNFYITMRDKLVPVVQVFEGLSTPTPPPLPAAPAQPIESEVSQGLAQPESIPFYYRDEMGELKLYKGPIRLGTTREYPPPGGIKLQEVKGSKGEELVTFDRKPIFLEVSAIRPRRIGYLDESANFIHLVSESEVVIKRFVTAPRAIGVGVVTALGAGYIALSYVNKKRVERTLEKYNLMLSDLSKEEQDLAALFARSRWMPFGGTYIRYEIGRMKLDEPINEALWPVFAELYFGEKVTPEQKQVKQFLMG